MMADRRVRNGPEDRRLGEITQNENRFIALGIEIGARLEADGKDRAPSSDAASAHRRQIVKTERNRLEAAVIRGFRCFGSRGGVSARWLGGRSGRVRGRSRTRKRLALGECFKLGNQTRGAGLSTVPPSREAAVRSARTSADLQHDLEQVLRRFDLVGSNAIKCCLKHVGESNQVIKTKGARAALDRMDSAERPR
jgi:hypothetical protein